MGPPARSDFNQGLARGMGEEGYERRLAEGRGGKGTRRRGSPEGKGRQIRKRPVVGWWAERKVSSEGKGLSEGLRKGVY